MENSSINICVARASSSCWVWGRWSTSFRTTGFSRSLLGVASPHCRDGATIVKLCRADYRQQVGRARNSTATRHSPPRGIKPEVPPPDLPSLPSRADRPASRGGMAPQRSLQPALFRVATPSLCERTLLAALRDHRRGTRLARRPCRPVANPGRANLRRAPQRLTFPPARSSPPAETRYTELGEAWRRESEPGTVERGRAAGARRHPREQFSPLVRGQKVLESGASRYQKG